MPEQWQEQVKLLLAVLPEMGKESSFALHGGTAINLFVRDMPRLSVDIPLPSSPLCGGRCKNWSGFVGIDHRTGPHIWQSWSGCFMNDVICQAGCTFCKWGMLVVEHKQEQRGEAGCCHP